jgi:hypothetical protein
MNFLSSISSYISLDVRGIEHRDLHHSELHICHLKPVSARDTKQFSAWLGYRTMVETIVKMVQREGDVRNIALLRRTESSTQF